MDRNLLVGKSALIVEDEMLVLMAIEDLLSDLGCEKIAAAATVAQALELIATTHFDLATLDLNLDGDRSYRVADELADRGTPFLFSTGYGNQGLPACHAGRPVLQKPYNNRDFQRAVLQLLAA